jgi:Cu/Ag efflux protein CusF
MRYDRSTTRGRRIGGVNVAGSFPVGTDCGVSTDAEPIGPPPACLKLCSEHREVSMKLARLVVAGAALIVIPATLPSAGFAQQNSAQQNSAQPKMTGMVTTIDRISGTIGVKDTPSGTVGASGAAEQQYKAPEGALNTLHAGDRITFTVSESGGKKTITKIEPQ